ncbi:MAG: prefoldin subunit beta [Candidatus Thermoplasmatota archaeon]|nr:prefoldin subunit beta [Candidatus Thermoplasmatota archaeon]MCL5800771.1 prefoldin subunit beta [Candidatus Thermoplasmatota archaeon]
MENNISNSVQNQLRQMQQFEVQLEDTASQKYQLEMKSREIDKTLEELEGLGDSPALYKMVGNILYKVENKSKLVEDLKEQKELSQIRIKTLERQQKALEDKLKELDQSMKKSYEEMKKRAPQ